MDTSVLLAELESLAEQNVTSLPSPQQLFNVGRLLYRLSVQGASDNSADGLFEAYRHLVKVIPETSWEMILSRFQRGILMLVNRSSENSVDDLMAASEALNGLCVNAPHLCRIGYSKAWMQTLATVYDKLILKDATIKQKQVVLSLMSSMMLDGLIVKMRTEKEGIAEEQLLEVIRIMEEKSTDCMGHLQNWQVSNEPLRRTLESAIRTLPGGKDDTVQQQREYLLSMLESARIADSTSTSNVATAMAQTSEMSRPEVAKKPISAADELERRIQQVKQILPHLGEGFIEVVLSFFQGNVEMAISSLLGDPSTYPSAFRSIDPTLPRRRKERSADEMEEAAKARQLVKERVAVEQKQEEARYNALVYVQNQEKREQQSQQRQGPDHAHDEYDDDYDDQYDDFEVINLGGADDGWADFEQVKLYNKVTREAEAEDSFWEQNRNTNRGGNNGSNNNNIQKKENDDEGESKKQYRGPDKIKGGRIIGPDGKVVRKPGGGRGNKGRNAGKNNASDTASSSEQKSQAVANGGNKQGGSQQNQQKPRTKPKAQNRVNRQRDKKQMAQGTFGEPN